MDIKSVLVIKYIHLTYVSLYMCLICRLQRSVKAEEEKFVRDVPAGCRYVVIHLINSIGNFMFSRFWNFSTRPKDL